MEIKIFKDELNSIYTIKQNDSEAPIVRAGLGNIELIFALFSFIIGLFLIFYSSEIMLLGILLITSSLLWIRRYDRFITKLTLQGDKIIFNCSFRTLVISREQIKRIKVFDPFFWQGGGDIMIFIKLYNKMFIKMFHITTMFVSFSDRKKIYLEVKNILENYVSKN